MGGRATLLHGQRRCGGEGGGSSLDVPGNQRRPGPLPHPSVPLSPVTCTQLVLRGRGPSLGTGGWRTSVGSALCVLGSHPSPTPSGCVDHVRVSGRPMCPCVAAGRSATPSRAGLECLWGTAGSPRTPGPCGQVGVVRTALTSQGTFSLGTGKRRTGELGYSRCRAFTW